MSDRKGIADSRLEPDMGTGPVPTQRHDTLMADSPARGVVPGAEAIRGPGDISLAGTITFGSGDTVATQQPPVTLEATLVDTDAENRVFYENEILRRERDQLLREQQRLRREQERLRQAGQRQDHEEDRPHPDENQEDRQPPLCHPAGNKRLYALGTAVILVIITGTVVGVVLSLTLGSTPSTTPDSQTTGGNSSSRNVTDPARNVVFLRNRHLSEGNDEEDSAAGGMQDEQAIMIGPNPCSRVDYRIGDDLQDRRFCLEYEALPYIQLDCNGLNQTVPKIYHSVGPGPQKHHQLAIALSNPHYKRNHHDDASALAYIEKKCGPEVAAAYACIAAPAYRADIFRFCALYAEGGIYLDEDISPASPLDDLYSPCAMATIGHDVPQDGHPGKQMKILAGQPGANIFKCALERSTENVRNRRYPRRGPLALTGPLLLHDCYEIYPNDVAVIYHDTRHAKWPYTGMRAGNKILAVELPLDSRHFAETGGESDLGDYGYLFLARKIYRETCTSNDFIFPSIDKRIKYYMGSWWYDHIMEETRSLCDDVHWYDDIRRQYHSAKVKISNGEDWLTYGPNLFALGSLDTSSVHYYLRDSQDYLASSWDGDQPLFLLHFGDTVNYYDLPVTVKTRPSGKYPRTDGLSHPIIAPLEMERHFGPLALVKEQDIEWRDKRESLVWRGVSTGAGSRSRLISQIFDRFYPEDLDVGITKLVQGDEKMEEFKRLLKPALSMKDQLMFKYILSLEGNDVASGLKWQLYSNSVVFMPRPTRVSWAMEDQLVPYYHYIPLADDLSDIHEKIEWARANDGYCRSIAQHATRYVEALWASEKALQDTKQILKGMVQKYQRRFGRALEQCVSPQTYNGQGLFRGWKRETKSHNVKQQSGNMIHPRSTLLTPQKNQQAVETSVLLTRPTQKEKVLFSREPTLIPGCSIKFQNTNMSLCHFIPYGAYFGDEVGPAVVKRLLEHHFGCTSDDVPVIDMASANPGKLRENRTCLFALGSVFHYVGTGDHVWGTGINPSHQGGHPEWLHIHSVRGPKTERKMKEWYNKTEVPKGDPGFLIPSLYQDYYHLPTKSIGVEPAYTQPRFCFIPHAHDLELDFIKNPPHELQIISVKQQWQPMMEAVRMCDYVVSTSLHGIVVADALGIPSKWFQFPNSTTQKTEGSFKYQDYLSSIGRTNQEPDRSASMAAFKHTSSYMGPIPAERRRELAEQFMSSFPYQIFRKSLTPMKATEVQPDCYVHFKDKNIALCVLSNDKGFVNAIGVDVVKRLLENRFGCSASKLQVTEYNSETWKQRKHKCLWTESMEHAVAGDFVWGAGAKTETKRFGKVAAGLDIRSVRGPDTVAAVKKRFASPDIPLGDPGFLLPYLHRDLLDSANRLESSSRFCYVSGDGDDEQQVSRKLPSGVSLISTRLPSMQALESLQRCDFVASSSYNGMVLADSLGIPTKWFVFERRDESDSFELNDYFSSTRRGSGKVEYEFDKITDQDGYVEPLSLDDRESFADQTAATFPFDLFHAEQNRTLVIIMGNIRGGELAWESMYKNVLDLNSADLALVIGERLPEKRTSSLYKRAKYLYEFPEFNDWADAVDLINGTAWRDELLPYVSKEHGLFGAADGRKGSGAVIFMARWYVAKAIEEYGLNERYDRFVLTRADHYYGCEHDLSVLDPLFVWVPLGQDYGGITDRHMICNSRQILKALDIFPTAIHHPTKYVDVDLFRTNPERMIVRRWKEENLWDSVRRFDRMMYTCAAAGDDTRWQGRSHEKTEEGVFLKYTEEYNQTKCVCSGRKWDEATVTCGSSSTLHSPSNPKQVDSPAV